MNGDTIKVQERFFAAANGYSGFRSYFDSIFNPTNFSSIYILKGGPGTGKSSFMKKIAEHFSAPASCEAIYCSSDPKSLDGVIISNKDSKIAIIDGTSPHATDPVCPGATDSIINLGDFWDKKLLKNNRAKIEKINLQKSESYKMAYRYLGVCGKIYELIFEKIKGLYTHSDKEWILELCGNLHSGNGEKRVRLITSYGKYGFSRLRTLEEGAKERVYVSGIFGSEYLFMSHLADYLSSRNINHTLCPSPLKEENIDAIYIPESDTAIIADAKHPAGLNNAIDTSQFIATETLNDIRAILEFLWKEHEIWLWGSADQFKKASDAHFSLENIYTAAMDFAQIDKIRVDLIGEIEKTLSLN